MEGFQRGQDGAIRSFCTSIQIVLTNPADQCARRHLRLHWIPYCQVDHIRTLITRVCITPSIHITTIPTIIWAKKAIQFRVKNLHPCHQRSTTSTMNDDKFLPGTHSRCAQTDPDCSVSPPDSLQKIGLQILEDSPVDIRFALKIHF